jgi:hypothetical protein
MRGRAHQSNSRMLQSAETRLQARVIRLTSLPVSSSSTWSDYELRLGGTVYFLEPSCNKSRLISTSDLSHSIAPRANLVFSRILNFIRVRWSASRGQSSYVGAPLQGTVARWRTRLCNFTTWHEEPLEPASGPCISLGHQISSRSFHQATMN